MLQYHFKKEKLEDGGFVSRPRILIRLHGENGAVEVPALIDSGCDITVIPESLATAIGMNISGKKHKLYAFRESSDAIQIKASITFIAKALRQNITLTIPVLIVLPKENEVDEEGIVLGIRGVFDAFDITFKKTENKIMMKPKEVAIS